MNIEKAKKIVREIREKDEVILEKNIVMQGLQILAKYEKDVRPKFDKNILWASDFKKTVKKMPIEEVILMAKWGWSYDEYEKYIDSYVERWAYKVYVPGENVFR